MSDLAPYFRPPWALTLWVDDFAVYAEIPMKPQPYIVRFSLTDNGLNKALNMLREIHRESPSARAQEPAKPPPGHVAVAHPAVKRKGASYTDDQRERARAILKKAGLI